MEQIEFVTLHDPKQMPGQRQPVLEWPYREGLRIDEAMHPLTLLTFGLYGEVLPRQNGAPVRLVVPWKYGFKSIKSIVRISLVEKMPKTTWNLMAANEYGFELLGPEPLIPAQSIRLWRQDQPQYSLTLRTDGVHPFAVHTGAAAP